MNFEEFRDQFAKGLMGGGYVRGLTTDIYNCVVALMNFASVADAFWRSRGSWWCAWRRKLVALVEFGVF